MQVITSEMLVWTVRLLPARGFPDREMRTTCTEPATCVSRQLTSELTYSGRKIKCDEGRPACRRCASAGRRCEGYQSTSIPLGMDKRATFIRAAVATHPSLGGAAGTTLPPAWNLAALASHFQFIHKPIVGLTFNCETEAQGILISSRSEPAVRYALLSLSSLRRNHAKYGNFAAIKTHHKHELRATLESYNMAIASLAKRLSQGGLPAAEAALQCCQLFISIEIMQHNYQTAMKHFARGLTIMQEWRARAYTNEAGTLTGPANPDLPKVDVFALKLFFSPCPGSRRVTLKGFQNGLSSCNTAFQDNLAVMIQDPERTKDIRKWRSELHAIAYGTFSYLEETIWSKPEETELKLKKARLLSLLEDWYQATKYLRQESGDLWPARVDELAMFMFYNVLRVVLKSSLSSSEEFSSVLCSEVASMLTVSELLTQVRGEALLLG
ncbi:hypothetical protein BX600DRAFT_114915 [Xylariales sp. PMI_506]|nr:hypothetical protein BX600DRAFT_114915 [Xylariales sp. PMI_506]